jgi:hypothetical protein
VVETGAQCRKKVVWRTEGNDPWKARQQARANGAVLPERTINHILHAPVSEINDIYDSPPRVYPSLDDNNV